MIATDETNITEIELLPDGRICVFGTSLEVLDVLDELQGGTDGAIRQRLTTVAEVVRLQSDVEGDRNSHEFRYEAETSRDESSNDA